MSKYTANMYKTEYCNEIKSTIYYKPVEAVLNISRNSTKIKTLLSSNYRKQLFHLFTYKINDAKYQRKILAYLEDNAHSKDKVIYDGLRSILSNFKLDIDRGEYRINTLNKYINNWQDIKPTFYLDIGCFHGDITKTIGKYFNLNKYQTHGIDIKQYIDTDEFIYTVYDGMHIPYNKESFDLITCFMVLHHVPPSNLDVLLNEIFRVMQPGGILLLREHNATEQDYYLLDVLHEYYDYVLNPESNWEESRGYYKTAEQWADKFINAGFEYNTIPKLRNNNPKNPFNNYVASFIKPHASKQQRDFFRILSEDIPREAYEQRYKDKRNYIHWGQRKLLLSEIEFLNVVYEETKADTTTEFVVIYAGAAPGTHIIILCAMFPNVKFVLYDPNSFSAAVTDHQNIELHQEFFTNDTCDLLKDKYRDQNVLFISDIRSSDVSSMKGDEIEERVKSDQAMQMQWFNILHPMYGMFKFRLPWDDKTTDYLDGTVYIQAYAPLSSTETRLIVKQGAELKSYDNRKYEGQMFYFNKYLRDTFYDIDGELLQYDNATEKYILMQYNALGIEQIALSEFSDVISKHLSDNRSLDSDQPLSSNKKELVKKLIRRGLVPRDIKFSTHDYNIYVMPIYDKVIALGL